MKNITDILTDYAVYHTKPKTKLSHFIGVPLIILSLLMLFAWVQVGPVSLALLFTLGLLAYYFFLNRQLAFATSLMLVPLLWLAPLIGGNHFNWRGLGWFFILFIGGWALQLLGHWHEGNKPALVDNFLQVFTAPIFVVAELVFKLGFCKELERSIQSRAHDRKSNP